MPHPQTGIFSLGDASQIHLELDLLPGVAPGALAEAIAAVRPQHWTVAGVNLVTGFRPELWRALAPGDAPDAMHGFSEPIAGPDGFTMPATQHDAWIWLTGASYDVVFDAARTALAALRTVAVPAFEISCWSYRHSRDLTGFEDGTANPHPLVAPDVALIADGAPGAGGSVMLLQQWRHDTASFDALDEHAQELVIGRTKTDSVELDEEQMPADSHVARTTLVEGDAELPIFRRNVPYGNLADHGVMFVGFSADQSRMHRMLRRMAGAEDGPRDALTRYSTPLTGAYYFVPSIDALRPFAGDLDDD